MLESLENDAYAEHSYLDYNRDSEVNRSVVVPQGNLLEGGIPYREVRLDVDGNALTREDITRMHQADVRNLLANE